MKRIIIIIVLTLLMAFSALAEIRLKLATTTSTDNSGLLKVLLPPFERMFKVRVDVIAVGTGKALELGKNGDVDIVLVHARSEENKFVAEGYGINRRDVMYNDFVILGPESDPAGVKGMKDAVATFKKISTNKSSFVSRGDNSGTHIIEKNLWKEAGVKSWGNWYMETGQGMGATLQVADEKRGYIISDRGTYIAYKSKIELKILVEGDKEKLGNPYGIIAVNPSKHKHVNYIYAMALIGWVTSVEGQKIIRDFKISGEQLFFTTEIP